MRCRPCPAPPGRPCVAEVSGHRRYCELVDPEGPSYVAGYVRIIAGAGVPEGAAAALARGPVPEVHPPRFVLDLLGRMRACPAWVARSDCGCGTNECREGKGRDGLVTHRDCFACLAGEGRPG